MSEKKLTKAQIKKANAREDYEKHGLTPTEIAIKYGYIIGTVRKYIKRDGWQKPPSKDLQETKDKADEYLAVTFNEDIETLKNKLFGEETSNEIDEIQNLATVMMSVAKGNVSIVERTFMWEDGKLVEKFRHVKPIRPDPRAGAFYLELSERLATMIDVGEFETDAELEERYKGYYEKLKKQREEYANRIIE